MVFTSLACRSVAGKTSPTPTVVPHPSAAPIDPVATPQIQITVANNPTGQQQVTVTISQEQLTAYMRQWVQNDPNPLLINPQVLLSVHQIVVTGQLNSPPISGTLEAILEPKIDSQGRVSLSLLSARVGSITLPPSLLDSIINTANSSINAYLTQNQKFKIESLIVADGSLTFSGISK